MTHSEALKLALDALGKWSSGRDMDAVELNDLISTLEAALEQPEQEPVAWCDLAKEAEEIVRSKWVFKKWIDGTPLENDIAVWMADFAIEHTPPPRREWRGLTEEEIYPLYSEPSSDAEMVEFARAVEEKLRAKNSTLACIPAVPPV